MKPTYDHMEHPIPLSQIYDSPKIYENKHYDHEKYVSDYDPKAIDESLIQPGYTIHEPKPSSNGNIYGSKSPLVSMQDSGGTYGKTYETLESVDTSNFERVDDPSGNMVDHTQRISPDYEKIYEKRMTVDPGSPQTMKDGSEKNVDEVNKKVMFIKFLIL